MTTNLAKALVAQGSRVLAWDTDHVDAALGWATQAEDHDSTVRDLAHGNSKRLFHQQSDGFDVLRSHPAHPATAELTRRVAERSRDTHDVILLSGPWQTWMTDVVNCLVLVIEPTQEGRAHGTALIHAMCSTERGTQLTHAATAVVVTPETGERGAVAECEGELEWYCNNVYIMQRPAKRGRLRALMQRPAVTADDLDSQFAAVAKIVGEPQRVDAVA